jgi:CheY-like chemotaxis protein
MTETCGQKVKKCVATAIGVPMVGEFAPGKSKSIVIMSIPGNTPRLLIIDDQPDSVALLVAYLADKAVEIFVALDGPDGLAKAVTVRPDLVLLDVIMPGMITSNRTRSGLTVTALARPSAPSRATKISTALSAR